MKKALFILILAFVSFNSNSQNQLFSYTFSVDTISNTENSKDVLSAIEGEFEMKSKRITGRHQFHIQSTVSTSEEVFQQLLNALGYQLTSFTKILEQQYYYTTKTDPGGADCEDASIVCSNDSFTGPSTGSGVQELPNNNTIDGCLTVEHQSSWYYINIQSGGSLEMLIDPTNNSNDYDFAVWGPFTAANAWANCPPTSMPTRCSYSSLSNLTGMQAGYFDNSENSGGDSFVAPLNTVAGEVYILIVDNWSATGDPYNLSWGGTANLDCIPVPLPIELADFNGKNIGNLNRIKWTTVSEMANDYFILERSDDNENWISIDNQSGAGFSDSETNYYFDDYGYRSTLNYYRLSQVDYDGKINYYKTITIDNRLKDKSLVKITNMLGQEVDEDYTGARILIYSDGSKIRKIGN